MKRKALGRGLEALIPRKEASAAGAVQSGDRLSELDIDRVRPNPFQPRTRFSEPELESLAESIRSNGLVQPILVRAVGAGYQIIAGERRWRAAQRANLKKIPAIVRSVPDDKVLEVALVENIQRQELNPIEEATAYRKLVDDFGLTQEQVAERVGKNRATIANILRLLSLSSYPRELLGAGGIAMGHGRALLGLDTAGDQKRACQIIVDKELSVRQAESLVRRMQRGPAPQKLHDPNRTAAEDKLRQKYRTQVKIRGGKRGSIEFSFFSEEDLARLYEDLMR